MLKLYYKMLVFLGNVYRCMINKYNNGQEGDISTVFALNDPTSLIKPSKYEKHCTEKKKTPNLLKAFNLFG